MASSPRLGVVVPLGQPDQQPGQREAGVAAQPEAALGLDLPADAAQRARARRRGRRRRSAPTPGRRRAGRPRPARAPSRISRAATAPAMASTASSRDRSRSPRRRSVCASSVCCWAESSRIRHWSAGSRRAAATCCPRIAWATAGSSQVEAGERQRQPAVRLQQRARGLGGRRALGEQAGVDGQQHRGVEVVGEHLARGRGTP